MGVVCHAYKALDDTSVPYEIIWIEKFRAHCAVDTKSCSNSLTQ